MYGIHIEGAATRLFGTRVNLTTRDAPTANTLCKTLAKAARSAGTQGLFAVVDADSGRAVTGGVQIEIRQVTGPATRWWTVTR